MKGCFMELPFKKIRCDCRKWVAIEKDGELFVWCKNCKKEVKLPKITIDPDTKNS